MTSFDFIFRQHFAALVSYARLMVEEEDAKDVVQDVFVWLLRHPDRFQGISRGGDVSLYLLRSVYNGCLNKKRHKGADNTHRIWTGNRLEREYAAYDPDNDPIIKDLYTKDLRSVIARTLDSLPPRCREVFILSRFEGIPHRRIADILGISLSTVDNHIYNALKVIRKALGESMAEKKASL